MDTLQAPPPGYRREPFPSAPSAAFAWIFELVGTARMDVDHLGPMFVATIAAKLTALGPGWTVTVLTPIQKYERADHPHPWWFWQAVEFTPPTAR